MNTPMRRSSVVTDDHDPTIVEVDGSTHRLDGLTATIWELIDGHHDVAELAELAGAPESEVWQSVDRLADLGLLDGRPVPPGAELADVHQLRTSRRRLIQMGAAAVAGGIVVAGSQRAAAAPPPEQQEQQAKRAKQRAEQAEEREKKKQLRKKQQAVQKEQREKQQTERKKKQAESKAKSKA